MINATSYFVSLKRKARCTAALCFAFAALPQAVWSQAATKVLGQATMAANGSNITATNLTSPTGVAYDLSGNLYVADYDNSRVIIYKNAAAKANGAAADYVLGQINFTSNAQGITATGFTSPVSLALDGSGNLYVSDQFSNRILIYKGMAARVNSSTLTNGTAASYVIGQSTFTTNSGGTSATTLNSPSALTVDASGNLYVADEGNRRVMIFNSVETAVNNSTLTNGLAGSKVLGQTTFVTNNYIAASATSLTSPFGMTVSTAGDLYVIDQYSNRVLIYRNVAAKANGAAADAVLGQPNFTSETFGNGLNQMSSPRAVVVLGGTGPLDVLDGDNNRVLIFQNPQSATNGQTASRKLGGNGATAAGTLNSPYGLAYRATDGLWVADLGNNRIVNYASVFALPVKLTSFTATAEGNAALLRWETAGTEAYTGITLQRSADGISFTDIYVAATANGKQSYLDQQPVAGASYYRMSLTESNGTRGYSEVVVIKSIAGAGGKVTFSPNPVVDRLTITNTDAVLNGTTATITDLLGREVTRFTVGAINEISTVTWPAGQYLLQLQGVGVLRVVKQ